jgi:hypothetical protein
MTAPALRERLIDFGWGEWSQMGFLSHASVRSPWAQDPEALILFTLELGRYEPRLFDGLLDWMTVAESTLSVRRMRAMCIDDVDRGLVSGVLAWLDRGRYPAGPPAQALEPLFHSGGPVERADPYLAAAGFLRGESQLSRGSRPPDPHQPINLAFQLRQGLGVGIRAEVTRVLLTTRAPTMTAAALARSTAYSKRNVHEALTHLAAAGFIASATVNAEQRYSASAEAWAPLLDRPATEFPAHREWRPLFAVLRRILRWLAHEQQPEESDYLRSSRTRDLIESLRPDLAFAGIPITVSGPPEAMGENLERLIDQTLSRLERTAHVVQ